VALSTPLPRQKKGLPPAVLMLYWLLPSLRKQKNNRLLVLLVAMKGGGFLGVAGGNWGRPGAPQQHRRSTFPRQHRPKDLSIFQREIHFIKVEYCEDIRPQNQLSTAQEQHKGFCSTLQGASVTLLTIPINSYWVWAAPSTTLTLWSL